MFGKKKTTPHPAAGGKPQTDAQDRCSTFHNRTYVTVGWSFAVSVNAPDRAAEL